MSEQVVDREEIEIMMWTLADTLVLVRAIYWVLFEEDDEQEEESGDT
jgi:hypothetical protein